MSLDNIPSWFLRGKSVILYLADGYHGLRNVSIEEWLLGLEDCPI